MVFPLSTRLPNKIDAGFGDHDTMLFKRIQDGFKISNHTFDARFPGLLHPVHNARMKPGSVGQLFLLPPD